MKKLTHTPGPWLTQKEPDGEWSVWTRQPHTGTLATIHPEDMNGKYPAEANAILMACAPALLNALILTEESDEAHDNCSECNGEGQAEECGKCFPLADQARIARRDAIAFATNDHAKVTLVFTAHDEKATS